MRYDIKFSPPDISQDEINEVTDALRSGWITTGLRTKSFEKKISEFCKTNKAACLNSATACMELTLRLLGVGPGDEVITSAYTYTASCSIICHVGATPVLIDTYPNSMEMDYDKLSQAINQRTKVIIPVDIGGVMCNYKKIFEVLEAKKHLFKPKNFMQESIGRVIVLEDAAHAFGASQNGEMCGSIADFTCFSFHAVKNITTSEGGAVTWKTIEGIDDNEIYKKYMLLSLHGQSKDAFSKSNAGNWEYDIEIPGYKCNMTDLTAAIGIAQLRRYDYLNAKRCEIVEIYNNELKNENLALLDHTNIHNVSSMHLYIVRVLGRDEKHRNELIKKMAHDGIACNVHYKPLPMHTAYKKMGFNILDYQNAFSFYENEITLPLHTLITNKEARYVASIFKNHLK